MAMVAMIPPTLSTLVHAHHWWHFERVENGGLGRLKTLPFLCCQVWPSFRYARLLYIGLIRQDVNWREEKEYLDKELSSVEPFVESMWQVIIIGGYRQMEPFCINHILNPSYRGHGSGWWSTQFTLLTSYISLFNGILNFPINGPVAFILKPNVSIIIKVLFVSLFFLGALFSNFMSFSVINWLVFQQQVKIPPFSKCIDASTLTPIAWLKELLFLVNASFIPKNLSLYFLLTMLCYFPQVIFSLLFMIFGIGFKNTLKAILRYPALFIMGFLGFVFTPTDDDGNYLGANFSRKGKHLQVHIKLTFLNIAMIIFVQLTFWGFMIFTGTCNPDWPLAYGGAWFGFFRVHMTVNEGVWVGLICSLVPILPYALWYFLFFYDPDPNNFSLLRKCNFPRAPFAKMVRTKILLIEDLDNYKYEANDNQTQVEMTHL